MKAYERVGWQDHVVDETTNPPTIVQEGTPLSQTHLGHMDDGIQAVTATTITQETQIAAAQAEIKVLKDATLNNMVNNVFLKNFDSVSAVAISSGIYDPIARKIYV
ncbi:hypothetical protein SDC9_189673 [bioreactor metagenome]|uniref:Uncharacterized protein n=1 Tax=bioreactor metagenome TaxID=1076179 RepID=A0A645HT35_9ZZZZ